MDRALKILDQCRQLLRTIGAQRKGDRQRFSDATIILIDLWATLNNQPAKWACDARRWPGKLPPGGLPSPSAFSRRVRSPRVAKLRAQLQESLRAADAVPTDRVAVLIVDGHALQVARHSRDRDAKIGRGAGAMEKGYKLHTLIDNAGRVLSWSVTPMNTDEGRVCAQLLGGLPDGLIGYILDDGSYNDNKLFAAAMARGLQLVSPRRRPGTGLGHRTHDPARLRCVHLLEPPVPGGGGFGRELYAERLRIERLFGHWASTTELNPDLPSFVRGHQRVNRWIECKMIAVMIDRLLRRKPEALKAA